MCAGVSGGVGAGGARGERELRYRVGRAVSPHTAPLYTSIPGMHAKWICFIHTAAWCQRGSLISAVSLTDPHHSWTPGRRGISDRSTVCPQELDGAAISGGAGVSLCRYVILDMMDFSLKMMNSALKMMNSALK